MQIKDARPVRLLRSAAVRHPFAASFAGVVVVGAVIAFVRPEYGAAVGLPLVPLASIVAGMTSFREAGRLARRKQRLPWLLISAAYLAVVVGSAAFVILSLVSEVGAFGPMDLPIFAGYALMITGMLLQPQLKETRSHRVRVAIDGTIGAISVATVLWIWFIGELFQSLTDAPMWHRVAGVAYPTLDVAGIVVVMIIFLRRTPQRFDFRLALVAMGFTSLVAADLSFLREGAGRTFDAATPNFGLFLLTYVFFLASAMITGDTPPQKEYAERTHTPWWPMIAPYGWSTVMVVFLVVEARIGPMTSRGQILLASTLFVGGLVVARQFVAISEYRQLVERERSSLISTISHELRTPLTAMVGFLDLIGDDGVELDDTERNEMIGVVDQQARYLSRIVADLVLLARGRSDKIQLDIRPADVERIVQRGITSLDSGMNDVSVRMPAGLTANLDADRLQQAIVNLLSNAVRYGGDERLLVATTDGVDLVIEVHDSGPGIPRRYEIAIWERFERGAHRLNAVIPGSGVGLAIVKAIAAAHGGTASYRRSEHLGGACFSIRLPGVVIGSAGEIATRDRAARSTSSVEAPGVVRVPMDVPGDRSA